MPIRESQKKAAQKWDKENMSTLACKVKKEEAEKFKAYCAANKTTVNTELKNYILRCIEKNPATR